MAGPVVRNVRLGRTEARVSALSLGTWAFGGAGQDDGRDVGWAGQDDATSRAALRVAHSLEIRHWDTADVYGQGHAEELVGEALKAVGRETVFLGTKVGWDRGAADHYYEPRTMARQIDASLRRLGTETVDVLYLHHCDFGPEDRYLDGAVDVLHAAKRAGKTRFVGLSDWSCEAIVRVLERVNPDIVQPLRDVSRDDFVSSGLARRCAQRDDGVVFFSPLRHGLLLGKYREPTSFAVGDYRNEDPAFGDAGFIEHVGHAAQQCRQRFSDLPHPVLNAVTGALLEDTPNACALVGQRTPRHVRSAAAAQVALASVDAAWVRAVFRQPGAC